MREIEKLKAEQEALVKRRCEIEAACTSASQAALIDYSDNCMIGDVIERLAIKAYALVLVPFEDLASPPKCAACKAPMSSREPKTETPNCRGGA